MILRRAAGVRPHYASRLLLLAMNGEAKLIERIRKAIRSRTIFPSRALRVGIGDDAAILRPSSHTEWVLTCDAFLEDVHFLMRGHSPDVIGYKALARATSDIAAMGAVPRFFLLTLALPTRLTRQWLDRFLAGMARATRKFGLVLVGGDTAQNPTVAISIAVLGEIVPGRAVTRCGACRGDVIYASGVLGAAQLGLELVLRGMHRQRRWQRLLRSHLYPELRLGLGQWLATRRLATAMIDTSDGLSTDLAHICESSGVGARIWLNRLPAVPVPAEFRGRGFDPLELALHGGEDYELLFTVPRKLARNIPRSYSGVKLTPIGEITREKKICVVGLDGRTTTLAPHGWDHFRSH